MRRLTLLVLLLAQTAISAEAQKQFIRVHSNDSTLIAGLEVPFTFEIDKPVRKDPSNPAIEQDSVFIYSSNPEVAYAKLGKGKYDDKDTIIIKDFGMSIITLRIKNTLPNDRVRSSVKVVVLDTNETNLNKLVVGEIYSDTNKTQYINKLDDTDANTKKASLRKAIFTLKSKFLTKMSESTKVMWDVIPEKTTYPKADVVQFIAPNQDSTRVFFRKPGKHSIILTTNNMNKTDTIASFDYMVIGDDYSEYEYSQSLENFAHTTNGPL